MVAVGIGAWSRRHLLDVEGLSREEIGRVLDLAVEMRIARAERRHRSLLEDEVVGLAFYEVSTRTRVSFELAARALGATTVDLSAVVRLCVCRSRTSRKIRTRAAAERHATIGTIATKDSRQPRMTQAINPTKSCVFAERAIPAAP